MHQDVVNSRTVSIGELLRLGSFEPAKLQRDYCWEEQQQSDLLQDLIAQFDRFGFDPEPNDDDASEDSETASSGATFELGARSPELEKGAPYCLFGNIDLYPEGPTFEIYDGLQRITTFTVLFAVIRDLLRARKEDEINALLTTPKGEFRLTVPMKNDTLEADVLTPGRTAKPYRELPTLTDPGRRLRGCVGIMHDMLVKWTQDRLRAFTKFVTDHVLLCVTVIRDRRIASQSFVKNNSAGVPLKPEENLKGQLMDIATSVPNQPKAVERILWIWRDLQDDLGPSFDAFLKAVDFIERREYQTDDYPILLMEHIRRRYSGEQGFKWATDRLMHYHAAYRWLFEQHDLETADGPHASLRRLHLLKWRQWQGYAMLIYINSRPHELSERMHALDRGCLALALNNEQKRFAQLLGRKIERFAKQGFGKNGGFVFKQAQVDKIRNMLSSQLPDGGKRSTLVRWVEAIHFGNRVPRYIIDEAASVEHIYPRNPGQRWTEFEGSMALTELKAVRELLGNLCVLPHDELGNAGWEEKRREYARFRICKFAPEIAKLKSWTPELVQTRTKKLADTTMKFLDLAVSG